MQQNGSSGSDGSDGGGGGGRERQPRSFSPLPAATTRVRRFIQERRTLPLPRVMVVFSAAGDTEKASDAMSGSDSAEDQLRKTVSPAAAAAAAATSSSSSSSSLAVSKPLLSCAQEFPEVISLNVGGTYFTTRLSTLRRYEDTMLAAMFSGRHYIPRDADGRYFIDRDGAYFGDILNFLREGELPRRERVRAVHREAQYYAMGPLLDSLEDMQPLTGERVRQAFLDLLPYYRGQSLMQPRLGAGDIHDGRSRFRQSGAHRGDRQAAGHAEESALRQAEDLRLQGGDAHHALRAAPLQLPALRALGQRGQTLRAPLRGGRFLRTLGSGGRRLRPAALHRQRPGGARHHGRAAVHRRLRQAPYQPLLLQAAHLRVQDHLVVTGKQPMLVLQSKPPVFLRCSLDVSPFDLRHTNTPGQHSTSSPADGNHFFLSTRQYIYMQTPHGEKKPHEIPTQPPEKQGRQKLFQVRLLASPQLPALMMMKEGSPSFSPPKSGTVTYTFQMRRVESSISNSAALREEFSVKALRPTQLP